MKKKKLALRLAQILVVLVGISFVTFLLTYLSPGDPVRNMYTAAGIMPTEELVAETREELGLNDPLPTQYLRWLRNCLRGDFGKSYTLNKPVTELLLGRLWPTVKLTLLSMGLMLLLAVPLGMLSAVYKDRWIDYLVRGLTFVGCAKFLGGPAADAGVLRSYKGLSRHQFCRGSAQYFSACADTGPCHVL